MGFEPSKPEALLVRPSTERFIFTSIYPLGLGYLASSMERAGFSPFIADVGNRGYKRQDVFERVRANKPAVVGITCFSRDFARTRQFVEELDRHLPKDVPVVLGGPHPSALPELTLEQIPRADYLIVGEGEEALPLLTRIHHGMDDTPLDRVPGLVWKDNGRMRRNEIAWPQDLDSLAPVDWDLCDPRDYHGEYIAHGSKRSPAAILVTSRGCPYQCQFCSVHIVNGHRVRRHSVDYVMREFEILHKKYGFREVRVLDDNFTTQKSYVLEFCEELHRHQVRDGWDITLSLPIGVHLQTLDEEILDALKSVGVYELTVGVESGSARIQKAMKKNITPELVREKVQLIKDKGFATIGLFILGYPGETKEEMERTVRVSMDVPFDQAHFHTFIPFPGTPITMQLQAEGKLQEMRWEDIHFERFNYSYTDFSTGFLQWMRFKALAMFYFRPRQFWRFVTKFKSLGQMRFITQKALEYM
ncbi:MAG: B12-binding domain-containing radical SAM protein [Deltaproteobacteria bacterium]|nr:B12-binding domain-containing radical SAM protein [Deltaproteobacteria bacterium]